jgi:hypothetical protein
MGLIETLAIAIAAVVGAWLYGRQQHAKGKTEAHLEAAEAAARRKAALNERLDDAPDHSDDAAAAADWLRDRANR